MSKLSNRAEAMEGEMTYDNWKCTDPSDQFLGPVPLEDDWQSFADGEISLDEMGERLLEEGYRAKEVRLMLTRSIKYPIPTGYFGEE